MTSKLQKLLLNMLKQGTYIFISVFTALQLHSNTGNAQSTANVRISVSLQKGSVLKLLEVIEKETDFTFVYDDEVSQDDRIYTFDYQNKSVSYILDDLAKKGNYDFKQINKTITVVRQTPEFQRLLLKGEVKDPNGVPLPGATVVLKDTNIGTTTDFDGLFTFKVPKDKGTVVVSFIGYKSKELAYRASSFLSVQLEEDVSSLSEVVVTALGIKKEEKKLGYAQQTVSSEQLTDARPNNWSEALRGKVPGLSIQSLGGPLNSQQIKLRGDNSLNPGANSALIVVDGVPVTSGLPSSGASNSYMGGDASNDTPVDFGNGIADINPEDIDNVSILKGAGAAALYGSRAANGVVIITTKSGKKGKGLGVSISSNTKFDVITRWPDWQYEYGQGSGKGSYLKPNVDSDGNPVDYNNRLYYTYGASEDGKSTGGSSSAFGPKFNGQYYYQYDPVVEGQSPERQLWRPYTNNRKGFWRVGTTNIQNISVQGGGEKGAMRASVTHLDNEWIMPNTGYEQLSTSVNANYQVSNKIKLSTVVNYRNRKSDNLPGHGYNNHSIAYFMIFQNPNVDLKWYEPIWKKDKDQVDMIRPFSGYIDNPYAMAYEIINTLDHNAVTGNLKADIDISPRFDMMLRASLNNYNKESQQKRPYDINRYANGYFRKTNVYKEEVNTDFLLSYNNLNKSEFDISASVGGNVMKYKYRRMDSWTEGLETPGIYNLVNGTNLFTSAYDGNEQVNSIYGTASLGYQGKVFVDLTGRNDWSSTLPEHNWSFFYPSVNTSVILSEIFSMPESINFTKLRFSYAEVGNDAPRYSTAKYYGKGSYEFPSSAVAPTTLYNTDLKPEQTESLEAGLNIKMFNNRIDFDASAYRTITKNQILKVPLTASAGYSSAWINSGEVRNLGMELMLTAKPIKTRNFEWSTTLNWSANESKVLSLDPRLEGKLQMLSSSNARLVAIEGKSATSLYGRGFERSPDGAVLYDKNGYPLKTSEDIYIGETTPDWVGGFLNSFKYKNFRLNVAIDGQYGGVIYSHTHHKLTQQGKLAHTLRGREEGELVGAGVVDNGDGTYSPNTTPLPIAVYYDKHYELVNTEANSFDASFIKLREVSLEYNVPKSYLKNMFLEGVKLSVYGRNLAVISDFPIYDPEVAGQAGGTSMFSGVEVGQMPVPTEFGFNVKLDL